MTAKAQERIPMDPTVLRGHIRFTLRLMGGKLWSQEAEDLLLGTAAQESRLGVYRRQIGGGPGTGIYQIEPATERSLWKDYLDYRPAMATSVTRVCGVKGPDPFQLEMNLAYQHIMCRLRYFAWVKAPIPQGLAAQAQYWKDHYNTEDGAGRPEEYVSNYRMLVMEA
jgi:hypothetical protein